MATTSLSTVTHNTCTYNMYNIHGDCQAVQIGTSNTINESSNQTENDDCTPEIEDLRFRLKRITEEMADKFERKDEEIAALKDRVAELEAFNTKVEQSEVTTNTSTNTRDNKRNTSNDITLQLIQIFGFKYMGTITISKKDSVNDLKKLIGEEMNKKIVASILWGDRDGIATLIYTSYNNKDDYSLEQLGIIDQDEVMLLYHR